ncbi:hypothetical protein E2C01_025491 [Portunus trituberculatus]|uniref:Carbohydrate sulfotransferase 5 n=1 Tax=Portunus trituberculatus TaxID=210409 RepID=A0A5B7EFN7_PORTR|nr:hypothetical protein [Portunus trituberculatus]
MWRRRQQGSAIYVVLRLAVALLAIGVLLVLLAGRPTDNRMTNGGGAPSVLLWTMMRSGSRMTQYLLTAQPCSFPAEEPLRRYLRKKDLNASVSVLQDLLDCRFSDRSDNLTGWVNESYMSDPAVWRLCHAFPRVCWDGRLVDALCKASCLRLVRVVNEGLALALSVLQDSSSNTHIVHLVRDPRGMLSSRRELQYGKFVMFYQQKKTDFFRNSEIDVNVLCQRYHHDLAVATHLNRHYPDRLNRRRNRVHRTARLVVLVLITTLLPAMVAVSNHPSADGGTMGDSVGAPAVRLWTMMRSGSQMSQSLLTEQPCSFLSEETLCHLEKQDLNASVSLLQDLFACRVSAHPDYLKEWMNGSHVNDARVKNLCQAFPRHMLGREACRCLVQGVQPQAGAGGD